MQYDLGLTRKRPKFLPWNSLVVHNIKNKPNIAASIQQGQQNMALLPLQQFAPVPLLRSLNAQERDGR